MGADKGPNMLPIMPLGKPLVASTPSRKPLVASAAEKPSNFHSLDYYGKCMIGGAMACGITHASVVTIDVAKCRSQAHGKSGKWPSGMFASMGKTFAEEGARGCVTGFWPTFWGYSAQGLFKFGFNEFFKDFYSNMIGGTPDSTVGKMVLWAAASGSAEVFADVALCPFEMTKVRMQVILPGMEGGVSRSLLPAINQMRANPETGFPFGSLQPLWLRQIPYTMIKFVGFYQTQEWVYRQLAKRGHNKADMSTTKQLGITFACGYWAGIFCAIATQPFDNLVSLKGAPENKSKSFGALAKDMGTVDLFTKGLPARIIMIGTLTGLQWYIYGSFKSVMGFGTS